MRWRRIVGCGGNPRGHVTDRLNGPSNKGPAGIEMIRALNEAGVAQPDDACLVVIELRSVVIVGVEGVRVCMSVDERVWVIRVRRMQVLLWHRRGEDKPRHQGDSDDGAAEPGGHRGIMAH